MGAGVAAQRLKFGQFVQTLDKREQIGAGICMMYVPQTAR
jgi:hypothetical protein